MTERVFAVFFILVLLCSVISTHSVYASGQKGPRSSMVDIIYYFSSQSCFNALVNGELDIMAWPLNDVLSDMAIKDPNIVLTPLTRTYMMFGVNLNVNKTITTYSGITSPLSDPVFRKAVAHLVDKDWMIYELFGGKAERIDVPIPASQGNWWNTSVSYPNYPYEFSLDTASTLLENRGFFMDANGRRHYPLNWTEKHGLELDPLIFYVDCEDEIRVAMARHVRDAMELVGIPVVFREVYSFGIKDHVISAKDYHIYVGSQVVNGLPLYMAALGVFSFVYASFGKYNTFTNLWKYWSSEYVWPPRIGVGDIVQHCGLSDLYDKVRGSLTFEDTMKYAKLAQGLYIENCFEIPVCSTKCYFAYRRNIAGLVNEAGYGIDNPFSYLNAYRTDNPNQPIRVGLVRPPLNLNILYSVDYSDYQCLDKIYAALIQQNPYDPGKDNPWIAQDWETGCWTDPDDGQEKTAVTYWFRKDAYWVKPITGERDGLFNASDYEFTCHYIYAQYPFMPDQRMGCPHIDKFSDIDHIEIVNDFQIKVCFNINSMWAYQWPIFPLLPKHKWLKEPLAHNVSSHLYIAPYQLPGRLFLDDQIVSGSKDTKIRAHLANGAWTWLTWGTQFMWKEGDLAVLIDSVNGVKIDELWIYYWTSGIPLGYWPGVGEGVQWCDILEGCGTHYILSEPPQGGLFLNANTNFFLETPPLGEVDWRWYWVSGSKPRSGYYKIDILDQVKIQGAYGSYGYGDPYGNGPSGAWFPGADIDPADVGHISILDIVTLSQHYAVTFGRPP